MKIQKHGNFHSYSICGCQVKNCQSFFVPICIHEIALWVFEPLLPQILCDLGKIFTRGSIQADKKYFRIKNTLSFYVDGTYQKCLEIESASKKA